MSSESTADALRSASQRLVRRLHHSSERQGLAPLQRALLANLDVAGELTGAELARREGVTPQAANLTVAALLKQGLISVRPDPEDGRRRLLSLTAAGRKTIHTVRDDKNTWLSRRIAEELTPAERRQLDAAITLLNRLVDGS